MTVYASPQGDDTNPGTLEQPVRSITRAVELDGDVRVLPGLYPGTTTIGARRDRTGIACADGVVAQGVRVKGATNLTWTGGTMLGDVVVEARQKLTDPAENVTFREFDLSGGIKVQNGSRAVSFEDGRVHDAWTGVSGPGRTGPEWASYNLTFRRLLIEDMTSDGFQFGDWHGVLISDCVFRRIQDVRPNVPDGSRAHSDCIQLTGRCTDVLIERCFSTSGSSFVFAQPAIGPIDGLTVRDCMALDQFSVSIQSQAVTRARFENLNLRGLNGGLWLRGYQGHAATDSVVRDVRAVSTRKPMDGFKVMEGAEVAQ